MLNKQLYERVLFEWTKSLVISNFYFMGDMQHKMPTKVL